MNPLDKKSLALHKKHRGKMEIKSKLPILNARDLCLAYTPGVAAVSLAIAKKPRNAYEYTMKANSVVIITDGSAVLGLGNIGPMAALPVMEGKAILYKNFSDINAFPICLDTQEPQKIIEIVTALAPAFGAVHLEDIAAPNCFIIEEALKKRLDIPVLHDDQHCTAVVALAGLINALSVRHKTIRPTNGHSPELKQPKIVINGAGAAGIAIANLLINYGFKNLTVLDSQGVINFHGRENLSHYKKQIARLTGNPPSGDLQQALRGADVFIGVSKGGLLKPAMIKNMKAHPIIFALANPIPEIFPKQAQKAGAFIVATGRGDFPNQINNVLAFPGIFRGALDNAVRNITPKMLIQAAKNLAAATKKTSPSSILPNVFDKTVVKKIAAAIK